MEGPSQIRWEARLDAESVEEPPAGSKVLLGDVDGYLGSGWKEEGARWLGSWANWYLPGAHLDACRALRAGSCICQLWRTERGLHIVGP